MSDEQWIEVTCGKEHFQPIQYHGLDIGPFTVRLQLTDGETFEQAHTRAFKLLRKLADRELKARVPAYLEKVTKVASMVLDYNNGING